MDTKPTSAFLDKAGLIRTPDSSPISQLHKLIFSDPYIEKLSQCKELKKYLDSCMTYANSTGCNAVVFNDGINAAQTISHTHAHILQVDAPDDFVKYYFQLLDRHGVSDKECFLSDSVQQNPSAFVLKNIVDGVDNSIFISEQITCVVPWDKQPAPFSMTNAMRVYLGQRDTPISIVGRVQNNMLTNPLF